MTKRYRTKQPDPDFDQSEPGSSRTRSGCCRPRALGFDGGTAVMCARRAPSPPGVRICDGRAPDQIGTTASASASVLIIW